MKITINNQILAKGFDEKEIPFDLQITSKRQVAISKLLGAKEIRTYNRGNLFTEISFRITRTHNSPEDAIKHVLTHATEVDKISGSLTLEFTNHANENQKFELSNASIQDVLSSYNGNTSSHFYKIIGGCLKTSNNIE